MTCIAAVVHEGRVFMGGDSAGVGGLSLQIRKDQKVFVREGFIFGFTSSFRMGQLLRYSLAVPARKPDVDLMQFMCTEFVNAVRDCLKAGGLASKTNEVETAGCFLVGHAGRVFRVESDYQIGELFDSFNACGCGEDIAKGAMHATPSMPPEARILLALRAAEAHSAGVRGPFHIESV